MLRPLILSLSLLVVSVSSNAQQSVYVWRDSNGVMNYSDMRPVGGEVGDVRAMDIGSSTPAAGGSLSGTGGTEGAGSLGNTESKSSGSSVAQKGSENRSGPSSGSDSASNRGVIAGNTGGEASSVGATGSEGARGQSTTERVTLPGGPSIGADRDQAIPISTAPEPDRAVPISTDRAPDAAVPVSTEPARDRAEPIFTASTSDRDRNTNDGTTASSASTPSGSGSNQNAGGNQQATLYWNEVTKPPISTIKVAGYRVYVGLGSGQYFQAPGQGLDAGNVTSYTVQGLQSGTRYYFAVTTYIGGSESNKSVEVSKLMP